MVWGTPGCASAGHSLTVIQYYIGNGNRTETQQWPLGPQARATTAQNLGQYPTAHAGVYSPVANRCPKTAQADPTRVHNTRTRHQEKPAKGRTPASPGQHAACPKQRTRAGNESCPWRPSHMQQGSTPLANPQLNGGQGVLSYAPCSEWVHTKTQTDASFTTSNYHLITCDQLLPSYKHPNAPQDA